MKGKFIYICKTDSDGPERGKYIQPTRKVFPTRDEAQYRADGVAPSRKPIVVELPETVEVDEDYYPVMGCDLCGKGPAILEPRFGYKACDEHSKLSPVEFSRQRDGVS